MCSFFKNYDFLVQSIYTHLKAIIIDVLYAQNYWEKQKELDDRRNHKNFHQRVSRSIVDNHNYRELNHLASDGTYSPEKAGQVNKLRVPKKPTKVWKNSPIDFDIDLSEDALLYAGNVVFANTHRYKIG